MKFIIFLNLAFLISCSNIETKSWKKITQSRFPNSEVIGNIDGRPIYHGGHSGLVVSQDKENKSIFHLIINSDRGANGMEFRINPTKIGRAFLIPEFTPSLYFYDYDSKNNIITFKKILELKDESGNKLTGLPTSPKFDETPLNGSSLFIPFNPKGIDPEGIVTLVDGSFVVAEEYGPSLLFFNNDGILQSRVVPGSGEHDLPEIYKTRKMNRGFEGLTQVGDSLFAILQSPLPVIPQDYSTNPVKFSRIVEFSLKDKKVIGEYLYKNSDPECDKIGDIKALADGSFILIEQNGKMNDLAKRHITHFKIDPSLNVFGKTDSFESMTEAELESKKITLIKPKQIYNFNHPNFTNIEKLEGVDYIDGKIMLINDNDFGVGSIKNAESNLFILE